MHHACCSLRRTKCVQSAPALHMHNFNRSAKGVHADMQLFRIAMPLGEFCCTVFIGFSLVSSCCAFVVAGTLSGVIGVAITGLILDHQGGAANIRGWYQAHAVCAILCVVACIVFNVFARGQRLFD